MVSRWFVLLIVVCWHLTDGRHVVKNSKFNPCLVYVLEGNIILIHASYVCPRGDQFFSASKDILDLFPDQIKDSFSFRMSRRSAC